MNFDFLKREDGYYDLFADAAIEAERMLLLRQCVRWVAAKLLNWR